LRITEASFTFPKEHCYSEKLVDLIELMLKRDPEERPDINMLEEIVNHYDDV